MGNYTDLAALLTKYPETVILRRFTHLTVHNLLYYQAELAHLEQDLQDIAAEAELVARSAVETVDFRWQPVEQEKGSSASASAAVTRIDIYRDKILETRKTMAAYNAAIKDYVELQKLAAPSRGQVTALHQWLERPEFGAAFLVGSVEDVWDASRDMSEYFTPSSSSSASLIRLPATVLLHMRRLLSIRRTPDRIYHVDGTSAGFVGQGIVTVVSSLFPVLPILVLFFIHSLLIRLVLILLFTGLFAGLLVFGLHLDPDKILTITTAFAAIQVVFVGSNSVKTGGT